MCDKVLLKSETVLDERGQDCWENGSQKSWVGFQDFGGYASDESPEWPPRLPHWCPRASIYYACAEDTNPFDRVEEFVDYKRANPDEGHRPHYDPPLDPFLIRDPYEENAARAKYLQDDPVSFVIFGKPGLETDKMAELLSDWWKCVLVSPKSLVHEEIIKDTDKGRWISETLERGDDLDQGVIMNLMDCRIKQRDTMNRGYVVEGLPLIPEDPETDHPTCPRDKVVEADRKVESNADSSTSSSTFDEKSNALSPNIDPNARQNLFARRTTIQETLREVQATVTRARINPFATSSHAKIVSTKWEHLIPQQMKKIFESWPLKPKVIIYVNCPDEDVFQRREVINLDSFLGFARNPRFDDPGEGHRDDDDDELLEQNLIERVSEIAKVKLRCEIYRLHALPIIERRILEHNPQNVIKIDGRASVSQMFEILSTKLRSLPLSRAIIPQRIWESNENAEEEEEAMRLDDEFEVVLDTGNEQRVFDELSRKFTISSRHRWTLSSWKFTCPVELTKGRRVKGKAEYAVRFMDKIFFLSSETSMRLFLENPRPFVASMKPRSSCKIAIFGPRFSGKSELSQALARNYRAIVINVRELTREVIDERIEANVANAVRKIRNRVVDDLRKRLENERNVREVARIEGLNLWRDQGHEVLQKLDEFRRGNFPKDEENSQLEDSSIIRKNLRELGLEIFENDPKLLKVTLRSKTKIYDYAPENLRNEEPPIRDLSEHDPEVAAILEKEVSHLRDSKVEITTLELAGTLISRIKMIPDEEVELGGDVHLEKKGHFDDFMRHPTKFLPPFGGATLPKEHPRILKDEIDVEHSCWAKRLVADGNCLVTYADSLEDYKVIPGKKDIGALYNDKLYLFCSLECRLKFLSQATKYAKIVIDSGKISTTMTMKKLMTNLEYLEKSVANDIVQSIVKVRRVPVPDARFDYLCEYFKPASKVPAFLNVVDIAGLVKGAAEGQGLGNAFLSHISACDAIFHLCRAFEDDDVTHIEGEVNPVRDLEIISEELRLKDIEFLGVHLEKLEKLVVRGNDKKSKPEYDTLLKVKTILHEEKKHIRFADWSVNEIEILNKYLFLTSKPVIYLVNLSEKDYIRKKNKWLIKIKEWVDKNDPGASLIPFSGAFENKVIDMNDAEKAKYFEESKVTSALDKIIVQGYRALQLQYFFTSGADEVKAWTIQKGTKAPQAAGRIHGDFEKGFIMAEVMKFDDFKNEGSESGVKAAGKYRQQGRNYVVDDGDIIFFKFNAGAGLKEPAKKK